MLLDRLSDGRFRDVIRLCRDGGLAVNEAERRTLGVTEAQLGAAVAAQWGFPRWLIDAIAHPRTADSSPAPASGSPASAFAARLTATVLGFDTEVDPHVSITRRLRWVIDPLLLRVAARGGADWPRISKRWRLRRAPKADQLIVAM